MICPECGERYNFYEPRCPWCETPNLNHDKQQKADEAEGSAPETAVEAAAETAADNVEEEEECLTYKSRKKNESAIQIVLRYMGALVLAIIGVSCLLSSVDGAFVAAAVFLTMAAIFFIDAFYSLDVVREVKWYDDHFVLCTCYEKASFPFATAKPYKVHSFKVFIFSHSVFIFRKNNRKFYIDESDFPELAEAMKRLYCP